MWQIVAAVIGMNGVNNGLRRLERENKKLVVCPACEVEMPKGARCCKSCGSRDLVPKLKFLEMQEEAEFARLRYEAEQEALQQRHFEAKRDYDRARHLRRCVSCHEIYDPEHNFCTQCSSRTQRIPESEAKEIMYDRFPDIIHCDDDLERIDEIDLATEETMGDMAISLAKGAVKTTIKAGWHGTKFVLRKLLK